MTKFNPASPEIFAAVFGPYKTPAEVLADAQEADRTPRDYIMTHCIEAKSQGMETEVDEAFNACCEECGVVAG